MDVIFLSSIQKNKYISTNSCCWHHLKQNYYKSLNSMPKSSVWIIGKLNTSIENLEGMCCSVGIMIQSSQWRGKYVLSLQKINYALTYILMGFNSAFCMKNICIKLWQLRWNTWEINKISCAPHKWCGFLGAVSSGVFF